MFKKKKGKALPPFARGAVSGIPIGLGYLSVSFGFGILASGAGLSVLEAFMISLTNLTSAGQAQGVAVIAAGGTLFEMALVQFVINIRYALMALSLSQKLDSRFTLPHRLLAAYGITDEIFAVCSAEQEPLKPAFLYGMIAVAASGWCLGTVLGAAAGEVLPAALTAALGLMLYGMFLAIIVPPARRQKSVLFVVLTAAGVSCLIYYGLPGLSGGFGVIISAVLTAAAAAFLFPKKEEEP